MSCRTTAAGSALTTLARLSSGLSDVQTLSAFHALRAENRNATRPSRANWDEYMTYVRNAVQRNPNITEARRRSLLNRVERAAGDYERIDGATWQAVLGVGLRTINQHEALNGQLTGFAEALGEDESAVRQRFYRIAEEETDHSRSARAPQGYTSDSVEQVRALGLPIDRGSVNAYQRLAAEAEEARARRAAASPQRITQHQQFEHGPISQVGYDTNGGRLEITFRGYRGNADRQYAYQNVPADIAARMAESSSPVTVFNQEVRGRDAYRYTTVTAATTDSAASRCADCGQFAAAGHSCPERASRLLLEADRQRQADIAAETARAAAELAETRRQVAEVTARQAREAEARTAARIEAQRVAREAEQAAQAAREAAEAAQAAGPTPRIYRGRTRERYAHTVTALNNPDVYAWAFTGGNRDTVMIPANLTEMRSIAQGDTPIEFPVRYRGSRNEPDGTLPVDSFRVTGTAIYGRPGRGQHEVSFRDLACWCDEYESSGHCPHIDYARERLTAAIRPAPNAAQRAAARAEAAARVAAQLAEQRAAAEAALAAVTAEWTASHRPEDNYSNNYAAFEADTQAALARQAAGEDAVPYQTENATGGLAAPGSGRRFGVELEFDFPDNFSYDRKRQALAAIGRAMYQANLTPTDYQRGYHSDRATYFQHERGWKYEEDCTVAGEIISPAMEDTPETWENIAKVCDIIKEHGGVASVRTGSHVHVSSPIATTPGTATELVSMANRYEDVMYRVSQNPERGSHRPMRWCGPNGDVPSGGYSQVQSARNYNSSHNLGINLQSVNGDTGDHAEIRHWDGTLSPAVVQAQIKMSVSMLAAAERNGNTGVALPPTREQVGSHDRTQSRLLNGSRRALTQDENKTASESARALADTLFSRREDKAQFAALFAVTKWHRG